MLKRIHLITGLLLSLAMAGMAPVQASDRNAVIAGAVIGAVVGGVIIANSGNRGNHHSRDDYGHSRDYGHRAPPPRVVYYERQPTYYVQAPRYSNRQHRYNRHDRHDRHQGYGRHPRHDQHAYRGHGRPRW